jgi:hypothetical protein
VLDAENGQVAPTFGEATTPEAAQANAATTSAQTGGADGGEQGQVTAKTYTEEELRDRLERATAKAAAKAERRAFREALAHLSQQQPAARPVQPAEDGKPQRAQYADEESFVDALTDWKLEQRDAKAKQEREQEQHRTMAQKTESIYAQAERLEGFDRESFDDLPLTKPMVEALVEADETTAAKLMHYMAANPAEVERISKLSPARQAAELGKLEAKATAAPVKPSRAPEPISPVGTRATSTASALPQDSDPIDVWVRKERERTAKR